MRNSLHGMYELTDWEIEVKVGNNATMKSQKIGKFRGLVTQINGTTSEIVMQDVLYVPELWVNLLSITKAISYPNVQLTGNENDFSLLLGDKVITFDQKLANNSNTGWLLGVEIIPYQMDIRESTNITMENQTYTYVHGLLGHPNEKVTRATAKRMNIKIKESPHTICIDCAKSKTKRKSIPKVSKTHATQKGERIAMDISSIKATSYGGSKYWLMVQDEFTGYIWSRFLKAKSDLPIEMFKLIHFIKKVFHIEIKNLRCDNSGENEVF